MSEAVTGRQEKRVDGSGSYCVFGTQNDIYSVDTSVPYDKACSYASDFIPPSRITPISVIS